MPRALVKFRDKLQTASGITEALVVLDLGSQNESSATVEADDVEGALEAVGVRYEGLVRVISHNDYIVEYS